MAGKTRFIAGASRGFGRESAVTALDRGDQVAATAREADFAAVKLAADYFGRLDVTVYDAGCGQSGMVEEISEAEIRAQLETNLLGALWVTQAALPYLREQGSGHIVQVSSIGGISAFPNTGAYHASQRALEGLTQSLAAEVARFGVKVTLIVPTGYDKDWVGSSASPATEPASLQLAAIGPVRLAGPANGRWPR